MDTGTAPLLLVTGATGKVGRSFVSAFLHDARFARWRVREFRHLRSGPERARVEAVVGAIQDREAVGQALEGVTHVLHLATSKETPEDAMDVAVKGLFWLLEGCRASPHFRQFILVGGDAAVGHFHYPHPVPVVESQPPSAYPGCYALSKVLEETMLQQYQIQYSLNGCCLRAPWIMEKDDFKHTLSFGDDLFGGPDWKTMVPAADAARYAMDGTVPLLRDADAGARPRSSPRKRTSIFIVSSPWLLDATVAVSLLSKSNQIHRP